MDVDMPDAGPSAPAKSKAVSKAAKAGGVADEGKKRFEVKKVGPPVASTTLKVKI